MDTYMTACIHAYAVCVYACMYVARERGPHLLCIYMYVCMHVCVYACMYICMYASMYLSMYVCMYVLLRVCMLVAWAYRMNMYAVCIACM
jgi:hypothetical protein